LKSVNSQTTRLVIIRAGHAATETEPDSRHWTVQVVRRDATIGSHTFRLQDIYGLSSNSNTSALPASEGPDALAPMTYPPGPTSAVAPNANDVEDVSGECILCLSSPREVVLLPCRHLVACKECAINMVEYGAGERLVHSTAEEPEATAARSADAVEGEAPAEGSGTNGDVGEGTVATTAPVAAPILRPSRRKKRAKGWYCPICRQPYTSMLRISTGGAANASSTLSASNGLPSVTSGLSSILSNANARPAFLKNLSRAPSRSGTEDRREDRDSDEVIVSDRT